MKKPERQQRLALTFLFTVLVICIFVVTLLVVATAIFMLIRFEILMGADQSEISSTQVIIIFALAAFIVGAVVAFLLGRISMRPVNKLINCMNRLAAGDYKARISYGEFLGRHPTVAELTESFNKMAEELDSTEILRSDFIDNFSHEFKTPIVSIAGFAKLLKRGTLTDRQKEEYISIIEEESLRLSRMATNVLDLTKVENQTILTDVTTYNLSEQLRSCVLLMEDKWTKKRLEFDMEFGEYEIAANEELLMQIWINLIDNAIKFSPEFGEIAIKITETEKTVAVTVVNSGSMIPPGSLEKIFNKFYQADESHASEGNGVGLAIVKRVTDLHNGDVTVKSGKTVTEFTVRLPKNINNLVSV